jgi:hypothetical protein
MPDTTDIYIYERGREKDGPIRSFNVARVHPECDDLSITINPGDSEDMIQMELQAAVSILHRIEARRAGG